MNGLRAMLGATLLVGATGLTIKFRGRKLDTCVVTLEDDDTYRVEFGRFHRHRIRYEVVSEYVGVTAGELRGLFEEVTGLRAALA